MHPGSKRMHTVGLGGKVEFEEKKGLAYMVPTKPKRCHLNHHPKWSCHPRVECLVDRESLSPRSRRVPAHIDRTKP
jgi:hypothetical protein